MNFVERLKAAETSIKNKVLSIAEEIKVDPEVREQRLNVCNECEYFIKTTSQCKNCGCFMKAKTFLKNVKCPIGKWE